MAAATYNIEIDQGSDYNITIEVKEDGSVKNLTTYSARAQARSDIEDSSAAFSFTCTIPTPTNGKILMKLPAATSSSATAGQYVYDLDGNKYLDFISALGSVSVGYGEKKINNIILLDKISTRAGNIIV